MGLFKTKEEKQLELEQRLIELQNQFKDAIDKYHMVNKEVFILKGFKIKDNDINYIYLDKDTPKGYVNSLPYDIFKLPFSMEPYLIKHINKIPMVNSITNINGILRF